MKRWIAVPIVLLAFAPHARADDASKRVKVQELFTAMHMDRTMGQLMDLVMKQTHQMTKSMPGMDKVTPEQQKLMDDFQRRVEAMVTDSLGWKALEPEYVVLYANAFSDEEIDGMLTFYKSPVGQALLNKTPELTTKSSVMVQARMAQIQPKMNAMMEDFAKQMGAITPAPAKPVQHAPAKR